ncbi:MAG TPA: S49 family peptidase [Zeimonas sp.]|nr:S49 family peptidase [Zeimonas sp.]
MIEHDRTAGSGSDARSVAGPDGRWERDVLEKLLLGTLQERRRARRWGIFFKLLAFAWLAAALLVIGGWFGSDGKVVTGRHTALVDLDGVIAGDGEASAEDIVTALRAAFDDDKTAGVVLRINSPGGSPVQAGIIHDEIRRLRGMHPGTPLYAVVEEVCASGGYYVAAAADRIYVDKASLVGSIGVLMEGFGFVGAMEKLGVERRLLTAGANKGFLDSFSPLPEDQRRHAQSMLDEIHGQFIDVVRTGRGDRLKDAPELFTGLVWTGARSVEMGLTDALGTVDSVARDVIKAEKIVDFSTRKNLAERLARRFGATAGEAMARALGVAAQAPGLR